MLKLKRRGIAKTRFNMKVDSIVEPRLSHKFNLRLTEQYLQDNKVHLDVGCWNGMFLSLTRSFSVKSFGLDLAFSPLKIASKTLKESDFTNANIFCVPFPDESFDIITMWEVLEHLPKYSEQLAFQELNRILRPGGHLLISTPNDKLLGILLDPAYYLDGHRHYPQQKIESLLHRSGFNVVDDYHSTGPITLIDNIVVLVFKHLLGRRPPKFSFIEQLKIREYSFDSPRSLFFRMHLVAKKEQAVNNIHAENAHSMCLSYEIDQSPTTNKQKIFTRNGKPARMTQFIFDVVSNMNTSEELLDSGELHSKLLLKRASQNRVLYLFTKKLANSSLSQRHSKLLRDLSEIVAQGEKRMRTIGDTLEFVASELEGNEISYQVIKTEKYLPYVTFDVDLLVKEEDFFDVQRLFSSRGVEILPHPSLLGRKPGKQVNCLKPGLINIDMHTEITWQGSDYIEPTLFWQNTRRLTRQGVTFNVPSLEVEFLIDCAEILFERFYFHLLHMLSLREFCLRPMNWELIIEQTHRYGWQNSFAWLMLLLDETSAGLMQDNSSILPHDVRSFAEKTVGRKTIPSRNTLPYLFPISRVINIFWERIRRRRHFDPVCFSYWGYTRLRYIATLGKRFPLYQDWIPLGDRFYWNRPY